MYIGEEGNRRTISSFCFFSLTERQISEKEYHKVTAYFAERLFKERREEECEYRYVEVGGW